MRHLRSDPGRGLAARMGTTASAISRIESGQHATSPQTVKKLAAGRSGVSPVRVGASVVGIEPSIWQ
ncbi:MAG TPA: helix-turn-helix transcriptional regulator [Solirubrobacterales bacterium]